MRLSRAASCFVVFASLSCLLPSTLPAAPRARGAAGRNLAGPRDLRAAPPSDPAAVVAYHAPEAARAGKPAADARGGGIREVVPARFAARYGEWKAEFLSTETGRAQWARFGEDPRFTLTLVVTSENPQGGGTGGYKWDEDGKLVAATITLGSRIDEGYPNPIYFPVMNSLTPYLSARAIADDVLAAAKIAHEFGHLIRTANTDTSLYQLQSQLIPAYNKILLSNGRNTGDRRLVELAQRMGGTPVEIWEDREYWGEANAMLYLRDRFSGEELRCSLFSRIRQSVELYAKGYDERFVKVVESSPDRCGWN